MATRSFLESLEAQFSNSPVANSVRVRTVSGGTHVDVSLEGVERPTVASILGKSNVPVQGRDVFLVRNGVSEKVDPNSYSNTPVLDQDRLDLFDQETGVSVVGG